MRLRYLLVSLLVLVLAGCGRGDKPIDVSKLGPDEVAVASVLPADGKLHARQSIRLVMSRNLAAEGDLHVSLDPAPVTIAPPVAGVWKWSEPSVIEFVPEVEYEAATPYRVSIDPALAGALRFAGPREFSFLAEPLAVQDFRVFVDRVPGVARTYRILGSVAFNLPVSPADFAASLAVRVDGKAAETAIEGTETSTHHAFSTGPLEAGESDQEIEARIETTLRPARGKGTLGSAGIVETILPSYRRLAIYEARSGSENETPHVLVRFSDWVAADEIQAKLVVDPAPGNLRAVQRGTEILLQADWKLGSRYTLKIPKDLQSEEGLTLERDFEQGVYIDDLEPSVAIVGAGNVLALRGERKIAIETINLTGVVVQLDKVLPNNLVPFLQSSGFLDRWSRLRLREVGTPLARRDLPVLYEKNRKSLTAVDLRDALAENSRGVFRVTVTDESTGRSDSRLLLATDLGIVAKKAGGALWVSVVSIADLEPLPRVRVEVLSYNNQVLARGVTDALGQVAFSNLTGDQPNASEPFVITAEREGDLGFLAFKDTRVPMGDLDVGGEAAAERGLQAFVYGDRGIYRPGDVARLAWITRDARGAAPAEFPLTLLVVGPDARVFHESVVSTGDRGIAEASLDIPEWAPTGTYLVSLLLDPETTVGRYTLRVEDFMPDRMKVALSLEINGEERRIASPDDRLSLHVAATSLFGPPAAGRESEARVRLVPAPVEFPKWSRFQFGDPSGSTAVRELPLGQAVTDAEGRASWETTLPQTEGFYGWLRAEAEVEVTELGGGRAIGDRGTVLVAPVAHWIGVRRVNEDAGDDEDPGSPIPFEIVLVGLDGEPVAGEATATLYRQRWRTVLRKDASGRYQYLSEVDESQIETRPLAIRSGVNAIDFTVGQHGSYRLEVAASSMNARSSFVFHVYGSGYAPWALTAPEKVTLRLDKTSYRPGETARAQIEAPFPGLMLLTVERDRVLHREWVRLSSNSAVVEVPVTEEFLPNAYVVATLLRPLDAVEAAAPARAFGASPLFVNKEPATLAVEIEVPETMRPLQKLPVRFRLANARGSVPVTVAAVDEGILQITDFETPSPLDYFYRRRRLEVESFDLWNLLLPEYSQVERMSKPGGDASVRRKNLNPISVRRVKPVALWSGVIEGGPGWRDVSFDVPAFTGALRVMVVAAEERRFGSDDAIVRVRDPIVLTPNLPRFLAPGDEVEVPVQVMNGASAPGTPLAIDLAAEVQGPVSAPQKAQQVTVEGGKEHAVTFALKAEEGIGKATVAFRATAGEEATRVETEMAVRPPRPLEARVHAGNLRKGSPQKLSLSNDWHAGTGSVRIAVSALPVSRVAEGLVYLLRYPYGCLEQTTSGAFPLLAFDAVARALAPDLFAGADAAYYVNSAIDRIAAMHLPQIGFRMWPGGFPDDVNPWTTVYATHFLAEAREKGFVVPDRVLDDALDLLARLARSPEEPAFASWRRRDQLSVRAYAAYVLAFSGKPEKGAMETLREDHLQELSESARYHLAGAYALSGNSAMFRSLLPVSANPVPEARQTGLALNSDARSDAIMLHVLATVAPDHAHVPVLLDRLLGRSENGRWVTTQENGWAFAALGKLLQDPSTLDVSGTIQIGSDAAVPFGREGAVLVGGVGWAGKEVRIESLGTGFAYYSVTDEGIPRGTETRDVTEGLLLSRDYFTLAGESLDLKGVRQGEVVVARLRLRTLEGAVENVVVADLLPAGLEVENARLAERGLPAWAEREQSLEVEYLDVRDDRLLLFTRANVEERDFYYTLRAVTRGSFVLPPVKAEAMYDPSVRAIRGAGRIDVVASH